MICFLYVRFPEVFSYHLKTHVWNSFAFELKETSLLKSAHTISFTLFNQQLISSAISRSRDAFGLVPGNELLISPGEFSDTRLDGAPSPVLVGRHRNRHLGFEPVLSP
jgi:hypothetical protein